MGTMLRYAIYMNKKKTSCIGICMCIGIVFGSMYDQTAYGLIIGLLVGAALSPIASDKKEE